MYPIGTLHTDQHVVWTIFLCHSFILEGIIYLVALILVHLLLHIGVHIHAQINYRVKASLHWHTFAINIEELGPHLVMRYQLCPNLLHIICLGRQICDDICLYRSRS